MAVTEHVQQSSEGIAYSHPTSLHCKQRCQNASEDFGVCSLADELMIKASLSYQHLAPWMSARS
jgi:hypothetical protein